MATVGPGKTSGEGTDAEKPCRWALLADHLAAVEGQDDDGGEQLCSTEQVRRGRTLLQMLQPTGSSPSPSPPPGLCEPPSRAPPYCPVTSAPALPAMGLFCPYCIARQTCAFHGTGAACSSHGGVQAAAAGPPHVNANASALTTPPGVLLTAPPAMPIMTAQRPAFAAAAVPATRPEAPMLAPRLPTGLPMPPVFWPGMPPQEACLRGGFYQGERSTLQHAEKTKGHKEADEASTEAGESDVPCCDGESESSEMAHRWDAPLRSLPFQQAMLAAAQPQAQAQTVCTFCSV